MTSWQTDLPAFGISSYADLQPQSAKMLSEAECQFLGFSRTAISLTVYFNRFCSLTDERCCLKIDSSRSVMLSYIVKIT